MLLVISVYSYSQTNRDSKTDVEKKAMEENDKFLEKYGESIGLEVDGDFKVKEGDYEGAIIDYTNALKKPTAIIHKVYFKRGLAKDKVSDIRGAIADYTKAIASNSKYAEAYTNRAHEKLELKDYLGAKADASKAIQLNPNICYAYWNRGVAKYGLGEKDSGCLDLSKAGELGCKEVYAIIKNICN